MYRTGFKVRAKELELGDTVRRNDSKGEWSFSYCIVRKIEKTERNGRRITLWRPYGTTAHFSMGEAEVICYHGWEDIVLFDKHDASEWVVLNRQELK